MSYVPLNTLAQFTPNRTGYDPSARPVGSVALNSGPMPGAPSAALILGVAQHLAQRVIPGAVEQARQAAIIQANHARALIGV